MDSQQIRAHFENHAVQQSDEEWSVRELELDFICEAIANSSACELRAQRLEHKLAILPCGHPASWVVDSGEGTAYCAGCEYEARLQELRDQIADWKQRSVLRWSHNHQREILKELGLADEFPFGCDAIEHVGEALLAARAELAQALEEIKRLQCPETPERPMPITIAMDELRELAGQYFDDIEDVEAWVRDLRRGTLRFRGSSEES